MSSVLEKVELTLDRHRLLPACSRVLVAVSGGVDSMVLLDLLRELAPARQWRLVVAHLNHSLRGRSSDADSRLVQAECRKLGLSCVIGRRDVKALAKRKGVSIEMAAREVRHQFLAQAARRRKCPFIALAHHADDQAELVLMRLLRGSGSEGLGGMQLCSPSPATDKIQLVRPLLDVERSAIVAYARQQRIRFREDKSNASHAHLRNRVRHELLPLIRERYQPGAGKVLCRVASILSAEADCINALAAEWQRTQEVRFEKLPLAVRRRVVQRQGLDLGIPLEFETVERLLGNPGQKVNGPETQQLVVDRNGRLSRVEQSKLGPSGVGVELDLKSSGRIQFGHLEIAWRVQRAGRWKKPGSSPGVERFDADEIGQHIRLRHWREGDRFQPIGMVKPVKLQDLFTNLKVTRADRFKRVLAEAETGEVFWVQGMRIGERFKLRPDSRRVLVWRWNCY